MKNQIISEIKSLKKTDPDSFKSLKQELKMTLTDVSTDDEGRSPIAERPDINKKHLQADIHGNTPLSNAIAEGDITSVRTMYPLKDQYNDAELLKKIALDMTNSVMLQALDINLKSAETIYSEVKYQLNFMGEDTSEIVDAYNFH